ncbi:homocysteine-responsive endoplasmic reticulum-resident ubiquitin-like domain member 2 protein [Limulus polyphemus]|uniref:Homocysteine-responsive endoplasmic reticulum-resident ubiquitin-like domain member 2 protein n=1 Tax=Limulus polyphemus TaxID=6850 RepID=A0ABM1B7Z3_LIMPO|nr:homocysteine-responsive endoplasmic reticulum-resident ubiquitin-like domain member 2 protein [Limulus polyphemus]
METVLSVPVKLVVKVPNQKIGDKTVDCELNWTVERLKNHLSDVYPCKPKAADQRLIYSGRLLHNHLRLKDVLKYINTSDKENETHVVHLVCSTINEPDISDPSGRQAKEKTWESFNSFDNATFCSNHTSPTNQSDSPFLATSSDAVHHRSTTHFNTNSFPGYQLSPGVPLNPEEMLQQMLAIQHVYAQYVAHYMQYAQTGTSLSPQSGVPVTGETASSAVADINVANENLRVQPQPANNNNMQMNVQGGPLMEEDEDEAVNWDWLDCFYFFSRSLVLFSIVFFYSSIGRFLIVTGISLFIYLYRRGFFGRRIQIPERENHPDNENNGNYPMEEQHQNPSSPPREQNNLQNEGADEAQHLEDMTNGQGSVTVSHPSQLACIWSFISSFFLSLVPEQPPPVNVN